MRPVVTPARSSPACDASVLEDLRHEVAQGCHTVDHDAGECGIVDAEGLRYLVRQSRRVRRTLIDDAGGKLTKRSIFGFAAWVESVLSPDSVIS